MRTGATDVPKRKGQVGRNHQHHPTVARRPAGHYRDPPARDREDLLVTEYPDGLAVK